MNSKHIHIPMIRSLTAMAALAAASLAFAQDSQPSQREYASPTAKSRSNDGGISNSGDKLSHSDRNFIEKAAKSGMKEVEISQAVLGRLSNQSVQQFAQMMVNDHSKAGDELKALAGKKNVTLPQTMGDDHQKKYDDLQKKSGTDFDKAYINAMVDGHESAVNDFKKNTDNSDADVKEWVNKTAGIIRKHQKVIIAIDESSASAAELRVTMAKAVKEIVQRGSIKEIFIEGGSTASAILQAMDIKKLEPINELERGVVRMKANDLFITVKPGSYELPQLVKELYSIK